MKQTISDEVKKRNDIVSLTYSQLGVGILRFSREENDDNIASHISPHTTMPCSGETITGRVLINSILPENYSLEFDFLLHRMSRIVFTSLPAIILI